jgi:oxaloacetate decarboxylase gamma subunit
MDTLLQQGLQLMLIGMGVVFAFLIVLVGCTNLMSWFVNRYFPEAVPVPVSTPVFTSAAPAAVDATTLRVIEDAIRQHRARSGRG